MNSQQKITLYLLLTIVLGSVAFAQVVDIPDPNLRTAIADALGVPHGGPITQEDVNRLTDLDIRDQGIANLTGLESATNLTFLQLQANRIEDIGPLANLIQLTELHLGGNRIEDIGPLANLTQLTVLRLNEIGRIEDISPLANLTQLRRADLDRNEIVDVSPLAHLANLESLDLRVNRIINVSPLVNLTQLAELRLDGNQIEDIRPLANLTNLVSLWLNDNRITDVTALANLTQLTELYLEDNGIVDVSPLENLTNLEQLDTHNNPIFDPTSPLVEVPDLNLRAAVREALNLPHGVPLTQASMNRLTDLDVRDQGIANLTGLEFATNLDALVIAHNPTIDLRPIAYLAQLEHLHMWSIPRLDITPLANLTNLRGLTIATCDIVDISPLTQLTQLTNLNLRYNRIVDITPLARMSHLVELGLTGNLIADVTALAGLSSLESLEIQDNQITDHRPLDALALTHFLYDQTCEMPPLPLDPRIENRTYPSIFARWGPRNPALHDLWVDGLPVNLNFQETSYGVAVAGSVDHAIQIRDEYIEINPNMVFIVGISMREYGAGAFPEDWPYWIRDANGNVVSHWPGANLVDFTHPYIQDRIVQQAIAVSKCGLFDGIFFDYWHEGFPVLGGFRTMEAEQRARDNIIQRIRAATRPNFLIMGNTNDNIIPRTGPYINGGFMETGIPENKTGADLERAINAAESALTWLENNLREPRINGLEGYSLPGEALDSPNNLRWMRALTALSLTHSDGYVLYSESGEFGHDWYDFWDADLGSPVGAKAQLYNEDIPDLYIREYTNGWAVYNHSGEAQVITLPEEVQGVASGHLGTAHALPNLDGEMYLRAKPANPADVNKDGVVNILDLTIVAQGLGTDSLKGDVNGDGVVNILDLVFVADQF